MIVKPETSLKSVNDMLELIQSCSDQLHRSFVNMYFKRLCEAVEAKLLSANEEQLRGTTF